MRQQGKNGQSWSRVCDERLLPHIMEGRQENFKSSWPWGALLSALLVVFALAGPVWQRIPQPVFSNQSALVILLDLSKSMDATDLPPNRLTRAQHKVQDILSRRQEGQTALVVYAAEPYIVSPMTDDTHNIASLASTLSTDMMPAQGSQPQLAIQTALNLLKQSGVQKGDMLLITDGWPDSVPFEPETLGAHRLSILGIGTEQGAPIPLTSGGYLLDAHGAIVIPKLETAPLQTIASQAGGLYISSQAGDADLDQIFQQIKANPLLMNMTETDVIADAWREEGPWLLLPVLLWAANAFRKQSLWLLVLFLLPMGNAQADDWQRWWLRDDQRAAEALAQQQPERAAELFQDPQWRAAAHYRAGHYEQALASLNGQESADSWYNRGNALARLGRLPEAIKAYQEALKKNPDHTDAQYNQELVKKSLPPQPQSQQGSDETKSSDQPKQPEESQEQQPSQSDKPQPSESKSDNPSSEPEGEPSDGKQSEPQQSQAKQSPEPEQSANPQQGKPDDSTGQSGPESEELLEQSMEVLQDSEEQMAMKRWLRRIPDDPGGLLRRKFYLQYQKNRRQPDSGRVEQPW
ncbi:MAG: VWA domain-containing protein [Magnetococcales bacterium]|nr:VWA domain-containing protein [Magnetococcales bacterium]